MKAMKDAEAAKGKVMKALKAMKVLEAVFLSAWWIYEGKHETLKGKTQNPKRENMKP